METGPFASEVERELTEAAEECSTQLDANSGGSCRCLLIVSIKTRSNLRSISDLEEIVDAAVAEASASRD